MTGSALRKFEVSSTSAPTSFAEAALRLEERRDVGAAEAVDRLLRVADDEEMAGCDRDLVPRRRGQRGIARVGRGDADRELDLDRVGVLELVEQEPRVALVEPRPHDRTLLGVTQKLTGEDEQVVELELSGGSAFLGRVAA